MDIFCKKLCIPDFLHSTKGSICLGYFHMVAPCKTRIKLLSIALSCTTSSVITLISQFNTRKSFFSLVQKPLLVQTPLCCHQVSEISLCFFQKSLTSLTTKKTSVKQHQDEAFTSSPAELSFQC